MKTYGIEDAKAIIGDYGEKWFEFTHDGVILRAEALQYDPSQQLHWKYVCELDWPDAPNPLTAPCLPFPFTANQLAAFILDGVGAVIPSIYGNWKKAPDKGMLDTIGLLGREPKAALSSAYAACRTAERAVGDYPLALQKKADRLAKMYNDSNLKANSREGVFAEGIAPTEARRRRELAVNSIADLGKRSDQAKETYQSAFSAWRKAMVNKLLPPTPMEAVSDTATPVISKRRKRRSWKDVAWDYVVETYHSGTFKTTHVFYTTLVNRADKEPSPFTLHQRELFLKEIGQSLAEHTLANNMQQIKAASRNMRQI